MPRRLSVEEVFFVYEDQVPVSLSLQITNPSFSAESTLPSNAKTVVSSVVDTNIGGTTRNYKPLFSFAIKLYIFLAPSVAFSNFFNLVSALPIW